MRILQLINRVPWPLQDGGSIAYYNAIKGYHDAGCEVTVFAFNTSKHPVASLPTELSQLASWHTCNIDNRIKMLPAFLNLFTSESYHVERFISKEYASRLKELLQQHTFDVIVFESLFMMPYIDVVRNNSNALCVLRQYNVEHIIWQKLSHGEGNRIKKWYLQLLTKRLYQFEESVLNKADTVIALSDEDRRQFKTMGCRVPIHISPLGIAIPAVGQLSPVPAQGIFHLGSMDWQPNIEAMDWFLQNVWPRIEKEHTTVSFFMAGKNMPEYLKQYNRARLHVVDRVEDAVAFMHSKQIMVVPLFSGSGIRIKILEGMALGKAIVSTTMGAQGIACEHGKNILLADSADEFYQCIRQLLENPVLCETLGAEARKLVTEKYSNTKITGEVLSFYKEQSLTRLSGIE